MFTRQTSTILATLSALGLVTFSQPAAAQSADPNSEIVSARVGFRDLNIDSQAGAAALLHRIRHAAKQACGDTEDDKLDGGRQVQACVKGSVDRAVASVNAPTLTALNSGKHGAISTQVATSRP